MEAFQNDPLLKSALEVEGYRVLPPCILYGTIGAGGMGNVYRGHHLNLDLEVAIKCLKPALVADDPQFVERFRREGRSAAKINHPNVIRVFDVVEFGELHYLIMELVEGESARQRVQRKGALKIEEALQIAYETAAGLGEAHRIGIVHRDIKPDNVLISLDGRVKVADLGLAKPTFGSAGGASLLSSPDVVIGTPAYMPPEQWEGGTITGAADVWALGATLYYLLTGREAIEGDAPAQIMSRIVLKPFPDVREVRPEVGEDIAALIAKATAKDPGERFTDAEEMAAALRGLGLTRTTLRDIMSGTGELQTMVSPPPRQRLELVKQALETESGGGGVSTGRAQAQTLVSPPRDGSAATQVTSSKRSGSGGRWALLALAAAAVAAGVFVWRPWDAARADPDGGEGRQADAGERRDGPEPDFNKFAYVDQLVADKELEAAIQAAKGIYASDPTLTDQAERLTVLYRALADQREADGDERGVLEALASALEESGEDNAISGEIELRREQYRAQVARAFEGGVQRRSPDAARPLTRPREGGLLSVQFTGRVPVDRLAAEGSKRAVQGLRIQGADVELLAEGRFEVVRDVDTARNRAEVPVVAVLCDGGTVDLAPWVVAFEDPAPLQLTFPSAPRPSVPLRKGTTAKTSIEIQGELNEPQARIYRVTDEGDLEVEGVRWQGNAFTCTVPLVEGENTIRLVAKKDDGWATSDEVRVSALCLPNPPTVEVLAPSVGGEVESARVDLRVTSTQGTERVELRADGAAPKALKLVAGEPGAADRWQLDDVELEAGANAFQVVAIDVLARESSVDLTLACVAGVSEVVFEVDGEPAVVDGEGVLYTSSKNVEVTFRAVPVLGLEVSVNDVAVGASLKVDEGRARLPLQNRLKNGQPTTVELVADAPESVATWTGSVFFDDQDPEVRIGPVPKEAPLGGMIDLSIGWTDAAGLASLTVDGTARDVEGLAQARGTWASKFAVGTESRDVEVVAVDRCGNETRTEFPIRFAAAEPVDPDPPEDPPEGSGPTAGAKTFPRFRGVEGRVNDLGYPFEIEHRRSGIRLVAIGFRDGAKPSFYAAIKPVTEKQWDGSGGDGPKVSISGEDIRDNIRAKLDDLVLPTQTEWARIAASDINAIENVNGRLAEWLAPPGRFDSSWPIVNSDRSSYRASRGLPNLGFRVVYRPK